MNKVTSRNDLINLDVHVPNLFEAWLMLRSQRQYRKASQFCEKFINEYGSVLKRHSSDINDYEYDKLFISLILFKGLDDYAQLCRMTRHGTWYNENPATEKVWFKLCDCRARLEFAICFCHSDEINEIIQDLDGLEKFFQDAFGEARYLSPGIIADKYLCSICDNDTRSCSHIKGQLYSGKVCSYKPVNLHFDHIAIVKVPKDPRCRIWPWNVQDNDEGEGVKVQAPILTSFSIDDFLAKLLS